MFARLAINLPAVSGMFDYSIPAELEGELKPGSLVTAPFRNQVVQGVVMELLQTPSVENVKSIESLLDALPVLSHAQMELAKWMSDSYLQPLAAVIGMMLPIGLSQHADVEYSLAGIPMEGDGERTSVVQKRIIALLKEKGTLRGRQIDRHFAKVDWRKTAQALTRRGVLRTRSVLPAPRVRPKYIRVVQLAVTPAQAEAAMSNLGTKQTLARRQAALTFLVRSLEPVNLSWVYAETGCKLADIQALEERGLVRLFESEIFRDPLQDVTDGGSPKKNLTLTGEQSTALKEIISALESRQTIPSFLLYGVTSSGKTEIYLRAAEHAILHDRQVIILVPEIALTPQTVRRFLARFPGQVGLVHSKLSEGERYDTWRRARDGKLKVIIGARSALFTPLENIGLIVADECHDASYYQSEPPFYQAVNAAQEYARMCGAVCVLGSATPTLEQRYRADHQELKRLELPYRVTESNLPPVRVVDMREELKSGNRSIFSRPLAEALADVIGRQEQAILFLNRRGSATYVFCRDCGTTLKCPRCDTPLTYHIDRDGLLCHRCGYQRRMPAKCAVCGSPQIRQYGLGSEKVETDLQAMFPQVRTLRWDWETTRQKDAHEIILTHFANHQADVLVGTQMLAKGLDLPLVTLVGIVLADVGLNLPDPFATERTFQVLTQVAGRAGRSARGGQVILQTFAPDHYAIQSAARHDVNGFHHLELEYRRQLGYPPFSRVTRLEYRHREEARAEAEAKRVLKILEEKISREGRVQTIASAVPGFFRKVDGEYRWQVILRGPDPASLVRGMRLDDWRVEVEPMSLL
jgi:primosomal protein N' (replication factor Y)